MKPDSRPDPDSLLREVQTQRRGRLKIFLGAAPGVGKTFAMLGAAHERVAAGEDVVVGVVETHGREETARLLAGLPVQPLCTLRHGGRSFSELDLDGLLQRRPRLALVDEFAHSNVPGSRHAKRHQDVEELLAAGINVWTTLNIQHVESLNDAVARITGVRVRETVPDAWLRTADGIELVDLPPETLVERLKAGKVYVPEQAQRAIERFFNLGNLTALRDLALRTAAERVDADVDAYLRRHPQDQPWPTSQRLLVCVGGDSVSRGVVRAAARIAQSRRQPWTAVHVINSRANTLPNADKDRIAEVLRLAEQLGGEAVTIPGERVAEELLRYARTRNVSQIVIGRPRRSLWRLLLRPPVSFQVMRLGEGFDVTFVDAEGETVTRQPAAVPIEPGGWTGRAAAEAASGLLAATLAATGLHSVLPLANVSLLYLLVVLVVAVRHGRVPAFAAALASFALYNFLFTEPRFTMAMSLRDEWVTLVFFLVVAVLAGQFAAQLRGQMQALRKTASRTANLNEFSRRVARARTVEQVAEATAQHLCATLDGAAFVVTEPPDTQLRPLARAELGADFQFSESERAAAAWCWLHRKPAGAYTSTLPNSRFLLVPMATSAGLVGVAGLNLSARGRPLSPGQQRLLDALADQAAVALERAALTQEVEQRRVSQETEQIRNSLLASVSHDLRTPIASVMGAASSLVEQSERLGGAQRTELAQTILEESQRLDRHVRNLLDMTRLSRPGLALREQTVDLDDLVQEVRRSVQGLRKDLRVTWDGPPQRTRLLRGDGPLLRALLVNLFENAIRHGQAAEITLQLRTTEEHVIIGVIDQGPGIRAAERTKVFEMFNRSSDKDHRGAGTGLGLSICKAIAELHGGRIEVTVPLRGSGCQIDVYLPRERLLAADGPTP
ncbi:MAG: DUF4118 domain-containing protein [Sinimarinibacterium flocculans]|uniref:DUF4118 domain-containing protein n=1 Tax=Sinimarinibacterium flocculans TaxID=985250 RepID=UPI003C497319